VRGERLRSPNFSVKAGTMDNAHRTNLSNGCLWFQRKPILFRLPAHVRNVQCRIEAW